MTQLSDLPTTLREDVAVFLTNDVLNSSKVFGQLAPEERRYLATCLHPLVLPPGQELFRQGQEAGSVLLLQQGMLQQGILCFSLVDLHHEIAWEGTCLFAGKNLLILTMFNTMVNTMVNTKGTTPTGTIELLRYQRVVQVLQAPAFIGELAMLKDLLPDARYCLESNKMEPSNSIGPPSAHAHIPHKNTTHISLTNHTGNGKSPVAPQALA